MLCLDSLTTLLTLTQAQSAFILIVHLLFFVIVGWTVTPKMICPCPISQKLWMLFIWEKRVFTVVIKYIEMKRSFWIIQVGPKFNDKHPRKRHRGEIWYRHKRRRQSENGAEIRVRQPQAKECLEPPEPGRGKG